MTDIVKLQNEIKHYEWGSADFIPNLLGIDNAEQRPCAELWMGTHEGGQSRAVMPESGKTVFLKDMLKKPLPYLFKALSAAKPLSIQAHPTKRQAELGFAAETEKHIPLDAANRNYKDKNHKPEILCALTPFAALCGFRTPAEIKALFTSFSCAATNDLIGALSAPPAGHTADNALKPFFAALMRLSDAKKTQIIDHVKNTIEDRINQTLANDGALQNQMERSAWQFVKILLAQYPNDAAVIAPLYLNCIELKPAEAIFLPAGILHAYVRGSGMELMAASDNVLRGGLTPKYVDVDDLINVLSFEPFYPKIEKPAAETECFSYASLADEFVLSVLRGDGNSAPLKLKGNVTLIVVEGTLSVDFCGTNCAAAKSSLVKNNTSAMQNSIIAQKGESIFISAEIDRAGFCFSGAYTAYAAHENFS
jgi:mannose-6-phosphate isomerase